MHQAHTCHIAAEILKKYFVTDSLDTVSPSLYMPTDNNRDFKKLVQALILRDRAAVLRVIGEFSNAFAALEQGITHGQDTGDMRTEANLRLSYCNAMWEMGDYHGMLERVEKVRPMLEELHDEIGVFETVNLMGLAMSGLGNLDESLKYFEQAHAMSIALKDKLREATVVNNIGEVYYAWGSFDKALEYFTDAIRIEENVGDIRRQAIGLNNVGSTYYILDNTGPALEHYTQSLDIFRKVGDKRNEAMLLNNIGTIYDDLGRFQEGLKCYREAVGIQEMIGDKIGAATTYNNIGYILYEMAEYDKALKHFEKSFSGWKEMQYRRGEVINYKNFAATYLEQQEWDKAFDAVKKAEQALKEMPNQEYSRTVSLLKAKLALETNKIEEAQNYVSLALSLADKVKKPIGRAEALVVLGRIDARKGDMETARQRFNEALRIIEENKQGFHLAVAQYYCAKVFAKIDEKTARKHLKKAVNFFENAGSKVWVERCKALEVD